MYIRKSHLAVEAMNSEQKTLRGEFGAANLVIDKSQSVKLGHLNEDALKDATSEDNFKLDREGFIKMIKSEVLSGKSIPDDLFEWLSMLSKGAPTDLLSCHMAVLEDHLGGHILMTLYDRLLDLEKNDPPSYRDVLLELKNYNTWKHTRFLDNSYLKETFEHVDLNGIAPFVQKLQETCSNIS